jgi:NADPH:quinone reductase-like Zn-dependent oxidoreductase
MLHRARVSVDERVLVTGASGGVGSAAVQLAVRRGARVLAVAGDTKAVAVRGLGAERVVGRGPGLVERLGSERVDVVVDLVGGPDWPELLELLVRGGRLVTAGAIAGPIVELDLRMLYLHDLTILGCTYQPREVFADLVRYVERSELRPVVAATYPLAELARAQQDFLAKRFTGKLVVVVP